MNRSKAGGRRGSSLILVLMVFSVFLILGGAVLTLGTVSTYRTRAQVDDQQAYFTARSAVSSTVRYIQSDADIQQRIAAMTQVGDTLAGSYGFSGQSVGSPTVRLTVTQVESGLPSVLKVEASATRNGVTSRAAAYLTAQAPTPTPSRNVTVFPFDHMVYVNGTVAASQANGFINGSIAVSGSANINDGTISDAMITGGDAYFTGSGKQVQDILTEGDVDVEGGAVNGEIDANGSVKIQNCVVLGNVYAGGDLTVPNGGVLGGSLYTLGSLTYWNQSGDSRCHVGDVGVLKALNLSSARVNGTGTVYGQGLAGGQSAVTFNWGGFVQNLVYHGGYSLPGDTISRFAGTASSMSDAQQQAGAAALQSLVNSKKFHFSGPSFETGPSLPTIQPAGNLVTLTDAGPHVISQSGYLRVGTLGTNSQPFYFDTDAAGGDISLILDQNITIPYGTKLYVRGSHRVFLYLSGDNRSFEVQTEFRNDPATTSAGDPPKLYILGTWTSGLSGLNGQTLTLTSPCVDAYIYLPHGTVRFQGGKVNGTNYNLLGSLCAGCVNITDGMVLNYIGPPDLSGTPLDGMSSGGGSPDGPGGGTGGSGTVPVWSMNGWADA